jgi:hypothetical protein
MSFRVFAAGVGPNGTWNYERDKNPDDDVFEAAAVISAFRASGPSVRGAAEAVADYHVPSDASAYRDAIRAIATMTFMQTLNNSVCFLAMCRGASNGWISVAPRRSRTLWVDTVGFARYDFSPGNSPGSEFIQTIVPALRATDMNNYGVLRSLSIVLSRYQQHIGDGGTPMIQIQLFK